MNIMQFFNKLYSGRHLIAFFCMISGVFLIKEVTILLYVPDIKLNFIELLRFLWNSNHFFLRFILFFNFIIKPAFIYMTVLFLFWYLKQKNRSE